uniref:MQUAC1 n=1 Tax=Dionaea muscipula TaxID=4362 RepID=M4WFQ7_DIOMU|nr:mQUAC1 [Dionaea muscipula]
MEAADGFSSKMVQLENQQMDRRIKKKMGSLWTTIWKVGQEDPRRVIHSFKVGFAVTLVSLLYLMETFFKGIGQNAIWAVVTVVVVLEFTAGATLCKGVNRGFGTFLAGTLGFLIEFFADKSGRVVHAISISAAVFVIGAASTYIRFIPYIKKNYDYGIVIFIMTFDLITVSSYRQENVLQTAKMRLYMMMIGCGISLFVSLFVFPFWSGEDLHTSTVSKLERLATSIKACVEDYFNDESDNMQQQRGENSDEDPIYKTVMDSKYKDEMLALYASWEPRLSWHCHKFPWQQYVKLGAALRHFGYSAVTLHGCLQTEIQTPKSVRVMFKDPCTRLAEEVSRVLMQLANSIRHRRHCSPDILTNHLHQALQDLDTALKSQPKLFLGSNYRNANTLALAVAAADQKRGMESSGSLKSVKTDSSALMEWKNKRGSEKMKEAGEVRMLRPSLSKMAITSLEFAEALPFAAFASTLVEMVARLDLVIEEVEELSSIAHFREFKPDQADHVTVSVTCHRILHNAFHNYLPSHGPE